MLTREADVSTVWRGFAWLLCCWRLGRLWRVVARLSIPLVSSIALPALLLIHHSAAGDWFEFYQAFGRLVGGRPWLLLLVVNVMQGGLVAWQMTAASWRRGRAAVLALVRGAGGAYTACAHPQMLTMSTTAMNQARESASRYVLPVSFQLLRVRWLPWLLSPNSAMAAVLNAIKMLAGRRIYCIFDPPSVITLAKQQFNFLALVVLAVLSLALAMVPTAWLNQWLL